MYIYIYTQSHAESYHRHAVIVFHEESMRSAKLRPGRWLCARHGLPFFALVYSSRDKKDFEDTEPALLELSWI